ncbi:hypothetical protein ACWATR_30865 [Nostoc sp. UIC 10890]
MFRRSTPISTVNSAQSCNKKIAMLDFTEEESNAAIWLRLPILYEFSTRPARSSTNGLLVF